jgi:NAD(P)-dependent dehydrogenase (short-subunit alcohol dehydrogenase family)
MGWLEGKAIVVTGAGRGVGAAYARVLAAEGARVVVNDIDAYVAEEVGAELRQAGADVVVKVADVSRWREAEGLIETCVTAFGAIDGLINNAGVCNMALPGQTTAAQIDDILATNVKGVAACAMPAIRHMLRQGSGSILNVTSGAHFGIPHMSAYAASKGAVASFTYCWSLELEGSGVRVNAISPLAKSRMGHESAIFVSKHNLGTIDNEGSPDPSANTPAAVFLLSDAAAHITGQIVRIEGSQLALVAHPVVLEPVMTTDGYWTPDGVAQAFETTLSARLVPVGVRPLLRAEYLEGGSAFWDGSLDSEPTS